MNPIDLLKSHVDAYTRKDGVVVQAHDDKRVAAAPPIATHAAALAASSKPGDLDHEDNQIAAGYMKSGDHKALAGHIKHLDTAARDHILDHVHPDQREGLGFQQISMARSKSDYDKKFGGRAKSQNSEASHAAGEKKQPARTVVTPRMRREAEEKAGPEKKGSSPEVDKPASSSKGSEKSVDDGHDPVKSKYHADKAKWHVDQIKKGVNQDGHISAAKAHIHAANLYGSHDNFTSGNDSWAEDAEDATKRAATRRDDY